MKRNIYPTPALPQVAQAPSIGLCSCPAVLETMMPPVPPWAVGNTPEPVSLDIDCFVDVTPYVRFETGHSDIDYGVLDIQASFQNEGRHTSVYLLHCFALAENYPKCAAVVAGWMDNFDFPPALAKMIVCGTKNARLMSVYHTALQSTTEALASMAQTRGTAGAWFVTFSTTSDSFWNFLKPG